MKGTLVGIRLGTIDVNSQGVRVSLAIGDFMGSICIHIEMKLVFDSII